MVDNGQVDFGASWQPPPPAPVDVVVGETPVMPQLDDQATLLSHDPRSAIDAARKRHAAKASAGQTEETQAAEMGDADPAKEGRTASGATIVWRPNPIRPARESTPAAPNQDARAGTPATTRGGEPEHFTTVPKRVAGVDLPLAKAPLIAPPVAGAAQDLPEDPRRLSLERLRERQSRSGVLPAPPRRNPRLARTRDHVDQAFDDRAEHTRSWRGGRGRSARTVQVVDEADERNWGEVDPDAYEVASTAMETGLEPAIDSVLFEHEIDAPGAEDDFALALAGGFDDDYDIGDTAVRVAPDVPRMCRTCRDFRPADSGERGWCNNNWAFSHRRMVDADELPCESSLGCWWLPHDDVWLSTADAAAHGEPTPLVDLWLNRRDAAVRRRDGS
ncbi:MAG: hypothetical protein ACRDJW_25765 [Thermomicrobiales bacterium]